MDALGLAGRLLAMLMIGAGIVGCGAEGREGGSAPLDAGQAPHERLDAGGGPNQKTNDAGAATLASGRTQYALVPGGVVAKSSKYSLTMTLGQSPGGNASMSSPKYAIAPGIVGATQTTPKK